MAKPYILEGVVFTLDDLLPWCVNVSIDSIALLAVTAADLYTLSQPWPLSPFTLQEPLTGEHGSPYQCSWHAAIFVSMSHQTGCLHQQLCKSAQASALLCFSRYSWHRSKHVPIFVPVIKISHMHVHLDVLKNVHLETLSSRHWQSQPIASTVVAQRG